MIATLWNSHFSVFALACCVALFSWNCTSEDAPSSRAVGKKVDSDCSADLRLQEQDEESGGLEVESTSGPSESSSDSDKADKESAVTNIKEDCKDSSVTELIDDNETSIAIAQVEPASDEEALTFLMEKCGPCHNNEDGQVKSFWAIDAEKLTKDDLINDPLAPTAYYSLVVKAKGIIGKPRAMPPSELSAVDDQMLGRVIAWFDKEMPTVARSGIAKHGGGLGDDSEGTGVLLNFKCERTVSFRKFLNRITNDAFNRPATATELKLSGSDPDDRVTPADRKLVISRLFKNKEWKEEFLEVGLRKFASKIAGVGDIASDGVNITEEAAADLKEEFYQYLLKYVEQKSWKDILLQDSVMVTSNTASFYEDCTATSTDWKECDLKEPRGSYFSTTGYLRSKPSSFLLENNNYGRSALMHFVISGDLFKAAFDGESGDKVKDIPSCLSSDDWRGSEDAEGNFAGFGAMAIPATGNLCQSCHIDRQMAAGSMLFRPFDEFGRVWDPVTLPENDNFENAIQESIKSRVGGLDEASVQVDEAFLLALLEEKPKACVPDPTGGSNDQTVSSIQDLASFIIGDGRTLAGGLARHMPRAMSNLTNTTEEIIIKVNKAFAAGKGKLIPIFQAYFSTETYACQARGAE